MKLVGICGAIASGKSTFAELLHAVDTEHSIHLETSELIVELANTLNRTLTGYASELATATDYVPIANELIAALIPQLSAMAGEDLAFEQVAIDPADLALHPDWYEKLFLYLKQAQQLPSIAQEVITNENKNNYRPLLQWIGGYFLYKLNNRLLWYEELLRRIQLAKEGMTLAVLTAPRQPAEAEFVQQAGGKVIKIVRPGLVSDTSDVTERMVETIVADATVLNNGSLKDLQQVAAALHADMLSDELKPEYSAR